MNMIQLDKPPENLWSYVQPPDAIMDENALENWIRTIIKQGGHNLHIEECFLQTIANVEPDLVAQKYKVMFRKIAGKTASAEFFLERISF
ncbi:MAG: hypothetical protein WBN22_00675 [Verrucomicrobiia bacterium]